MPQSLQPLADGADTSVVAVDAAARFPRAQTRAPARSVGRLALPHVALAAVVGASAVLRSLLALFHSTAYYLPDEYLYPTLARSLATTGRPLVRGGAAHFPALLEPILTAPFQLFEDPELAFRLTQLFHAAAMSIAAIPVYLLARRLRLSEWYAVACGGLAVAAPSMVYAGFMLADPVAYPVALTAAYLAVRALDEPTRGAQVAFLACAGLATFCRTQYVVLPLAFAFASVAIERRQAFRTYRTTAVFLSGGAVLALVFGPGRAAGVYSSLAHDLDVGSALTWAGRDLLLLPYAAGWILVPGALVGLLAAASRVERAYACFAAFLAAGLAAEAGVIAAVDSGRFQERYLMALVPLVPVAFGVYLQRGAPHRKVVAALSLGLLVFAMHVPLSGYAAARGKNDSPFLKAVRQLGEAVGVADGALIIAACAGALSLAALVLPFRRRVAGPVGLALTVLVFGAVSTGTYAYDREIATALRTTWLPQDVRWVDHAGVRDAALLMLPNSEPERSWHQLIWNRSVSDVLLLGRRERLDGYASSRVRVASDGRLLAGAHTIRRPLLVQTAGSRAELAGATKIAATPDFELWRPNGAARLSYLAEGWYMDRWLAWPAIVTVWPDASGRVEGTLTLRLGVPKNFPRTRVALSARGYSRSVVFAAGSSATIRVAVSHTGRWKLRVSTTRPAVVGLRPVIVRGLPPTFERNGRRADATLLHAAYAPKESSARDNRT